MNTSKYSPTFRPVVMIAAFALSVGLRARAQSESTIYSFTTDGPQISTAALISDASGNLYGTTTMGGNFPASGAGCSRPKGCGTVFELSPSDSGWTPTVLYSFNGGGNGLFPSAAVVFDGEGNLYGTSVGAPPESYGTVFELSPVPGGGWTHKVLHEFTGGKDGASPASALILDSSGNLYGTARSGGDLTCTGQPYLPAPGCGVVFKLERTSKGGWAEIVLHTFTGGDGATPYSGLAWDTSGNLFGTTYVGGCDNRYICGDGQGIVFQMVPVPAGGYKYTPIHKFTGGVGGSGPIGTLAFDASGALWGTSVFGGPQANGVFSGWGIVFRLAQTSKGGWVKTTVYNFDSNLGDGFWPNSGVVLGPDGVFYGTTTYGGVFGGDGGTLFALSPNACSWWDSVLYAMWHS